jgi:predicted permease
MTDTFSVAAAIEGRYWTFQSGGEASRLIGRAVTIDFFRVFGEYPAMGRFFMPEDRESVVLSDRLWRSQFGADVNVVGRVMMLDDKPHRIVGVAPAAFRFPEQAQLWIPLIIDPKRMLDSQRGNNMRLSLFARRRDDVTAAQAADRVSRYVQGLKSTKLEYDIELDPIAVYIAGDLRRPLLLLWGATLVVLLTGCANIAGLLLARTSTRRKEIAIRISVGAGAGQIVRQLLLESLLLGAFGGVAGLGLAALAVSLLTRSREGMLALVSLNGRMLVYGFALALLSGLLFGLAPAIQLLRQSQSSELARSRRRWLQDAFVTAEVGAALLLLVVTVLILRSLWAVERIEPGFDTRGVTTAYFMKPKNDPGFLHRLQVSLSSSPGVQSAALAFPVPFAGGGLTSGFLIKNRQRRPGDPLWHGEAYFVTPDYFPTLRIPLLRGRNLADYDKRGSPVVCVIDSKVAERFFAGEDPIGQEIAMYQGWARVVGVVGAIRGTTLEEGSRPSVYYSLPQVPLFDQAGIVVRSATPAGGIIREAVRRTNATVPIFDLKTIEERIGESLGIRRLLATLLSVLGAISLLLATVGLYGVIAQVVSERTAEIGIRMALGARPRQILSQFMRQGMRAGLLGLAVGFIAVAYSQRLLTGMLYEVQPFDAATVASAAAGILSLLLIAVWWPARRASRIDPQQALRYE